MSFLLSWIIGFSKNTTVCDKSMLFQRMFI